MKRYLLFLLTIIFSFSSCSLDDEVEVNFSFIILPIESVEVPAEFKYGESYSITLNYFLPSACYAFRDVYYDYDNNSRIIAVNSVLDNNQVCTQMLIKSEHTFTLKCTQTENYVFKFWKGKDTQGQDQYLIVEVPVNS